MLRRNFPRCKILLFDWDGTLVNTLDIKVRHAGQLFAAQFGVAPQAVEQAYRRYSGIPRRQLFAAICQDLGLPQLEEALYQQLSARFTQVNQAAFSDPATPGLLSADTVSVLERLQQAGIILYVSSSADPLEIRQTARVLGLAEIFARSGGEILGSQPGLNKGPEHVAYILNRHRLPSTAQLPLDAVAMVGDEPADIRLAHQAGVAAIAKAGTYAAEWWQACPAEICPDALVQTLQELAEMFADEEHSVEV